MDEEPSSTTEATPAPEEASTEATTEPPSAETAPAEDVPKTDEASRPSKSSLVVRKQSSRMSKKESHVHMQEPGDGTEQRPSIAGKQPSDVDTAKRPSEAEKRRRSSQAQRTGSVRPGSLRESREMSKQYMRRSSERASKARLALGSLISFGKASAYGEYYGGTKTAKFMNTYKLDSDKPFHIEKMEKILKEVLTEALDNLTYDPDKCPKQAKWACSAIRAKFKEQEFDRYKMVCIVTIGEKRYHDMCTMVRFLWDIDRDKYAVFVHENMYVYAAAMCFGIYYE